VHHRRAHLLGRLRDHARSDGVHQPTPFGVGLGRVHRGVRGGVHNHRGARAAHRRPQRVAVGEVGVGARERGHRAERRELAYQLEPHLPLRAEEQEGGRAARAHRCGAAGPA
jgi:hypothetical protein